jgi:hypothetical protein
MNRRARERNSAAGLSRFSYFPLRPEVPRAAGGASGKSQNTLILP